MVIIGKTWPVGDSVCLLEDFQIIHFTITCDDEYSDDDLFDEGENYLSWAVSARHASSAATLVTSLDHPRVWHRHHPHLRVNHKKTDKNITNIILIITMITSSLNIFAGGSSMSHGRGAPPRPGPSTSPPWSKLILCRIGPDVIKTNLVRSICPAGFSFLRERLQLIVVSRHIVHTWVDYNRDAVSRFLIDERDWFVMVDHDENDMMIISG